MACFLTLQANLQEFSRNPEMFGHMESNVALFREVNKLLKRLCYYNFRYVDLIRPCELQASKPFAQLTYF